MTATAPINTPSTTSNAGPVVIRQLAERTLHKAGVWGMVPVPVKRVAETLGYICMDFDASGDLVDVLGAIDYNQATIWVNQSQPVNRKRFTIAHEIGHAVLHPQEDIVDYRVDIEGPKDRKEVQANKFAAELLMPEEFFRGAWVESGSDLSAVAASFAVSADAASYRARDLGL